MGAPGAFRSSALTTRSFGTVTCTSICSASNVLGFGALAAAASAPKPSTFDALQMDVHVTVPNDLVVKADDLKAPGAPIGLAALRVTLGGAAYVSKTPWDQIRLVGA